MASSTTNMGLTKWDAGSDLFSHVNLSENWEKVDVHDHSTGKGVQIPTGGLVNLAVTGQKIAADTITGGKIASGTITDAKLSSPNNAVYRELVTAGAGLYQKGNGTYIFNNGYSPSVSTVTFTYLPVVFPYAAADYAVANKTTKLNIFTNLICGHAAATGITYTFGLYPVTASAGGGTLNSMSYTYGTVVTGSTSTSVAPGIGAIANVVSADFTPPADGAYVLGVTQTGGSHTSQINFWSTLRVRHV